MIQIWDLCHNSWSRCRSTSGRLQRTSNWLQRIQLIRQVIYKIRIYGCLTWRIEFVTKACLKWLIKNFNAFDRLNRSFRGSVESFELIFCHLIQLWKNRVFTFQSETTYCRIWKKHSLEHVEKCWERDLPRRLRITSDCATSLLVTKWLKDTTNRLESKVLRRATECKNKEIVLKRTIGRISHAYFSVLAELHTHW